MPGDVERGHYQLLKNGGHRSDNNNNIQKLLIGILFVLCFVSGGVFVLLVWPATINNGHSSSEDVTHFLQLSKSIDWAKLSNDPHHVARRAVTDYQSSIGASIKLVGKPDTFLTETRGRGERLIDKWTLEVGYSHELSSMQLEKSSYVTIKQNGIYFIYSQLTFMINVPKTIVTYEIRKTRANEVAPKPGSKKVGTTLAYCAEDKTDKSQKKKQCHTSVMAKLDAGDRVAIYVQKENFTVDFTPGRSFFGVTMIQLP